MQVVLMHKDTVYYLYSSIPRDKIWCLLKRLICGLLNIFFVFTSLKYLPLVVVTLILNTAPLLTVLFSFILYRVSISKLDMAVLILSFIGVVIMLFGSL